MFTINIDVGGTLTDGVFSDGREITEVKVDTTPHDLTVCLVECLIQGVQELGLQGIAELMKLTKVLRWSSTVTTNVLAERKEGVTWIDEFASVKEGEEKIGRWIEVKHNKLYV